MRSPIFFADDNQTFLILQKIVRGELLSADEQQYITGWRQSSHENELLFNELGNTEKIITALSQLHGFDKNTDVNLNNFLHAIKPASAPLRRVHFYNNAWFRYAAVFILLISGLVFFLLNKPNEQQTNQQAGTQMDIAAPQITRAMMTLSDGRQISLDTLSQGLFASEGGIQLQKRADGSIVYSGINNTTIAYNTVTVPRGSRIVNLFLGDGTSVFLNAASSIKYPVSFGTTERMVEITGEAYFNVARDSKRKFVVKANNLFTEVLGTQFNVSAYEDDAIKKITLLTGKVKVSGESTSVILQPGQQAQLAGVLKNIGNVDVEETMAWKNGKFRFTNTPVKEVMKQFSRWYNIDVEYRYQPTQTFSGSMRRSLSAASALKILAATGGVGFEIKGNKVVIMN